MVKRPRVALLVESTRAYGRGLLAGISAYLRQHGSWSIYWQERGLTDPPPVWLRQWAGDGVIARITIRQLAQTIGELGVPTVDLYGWLPGVSWPFLRADNARVVDLAAEHLLDRGFRHLAYCGLTGVNYSDERSQLFAQRVHQAGYPCHIFRSRRFRSSAAITASEQQGVLHEADMADWLRQLPRPVGILACNDVRGQQVLNACREISLRVPDDVAVLGVDNNELLCNLCDPPLSSIDLNCERMGYEAAALLTQLMAGRPMPARQTLIEPRGIITRHSTEVLAIEDAAIAEAVRLIRTQACSGLTVEDVLAACSFSASSLERRFTRLLGRTPKAEIVRVRLQRVRELLGETDLSLADIAARTGFKHVEYLSAVFKQKTGLSPGQYRAQVLRPRVWQDP